MSSPVDPAKAADRLNLLRARLSEALHTEKVEVIDESHLHVGHAGAREGKGHFRVTVVSADFAGLRPIARHQLIYRSLGELMHTDIHALSIIALTPQETSPEASQEAQEHPP